MKLARTLLVAGSVVTLGFGSAFAAEHGSTKAKRNDPGFNKLDKNDDGSLSRSEAAGNPYLLRHFKEADRNHDGRLSRTEYLRVMTAKDLSTLKDKVTGGKKESSAGAGGTKAKSGSAKATSSPSSKAGPGMK